MLNSSTKYCNLCILSATQHQYLDMHRQSGIRWIQLLALGSFVQHLMSSFMCLPQHRACFYMHQIVLLVSPDVLHASWIHRIAIVSCMSRALCWLLLLLLFTAPYCYPQAQKAQRLHEERAAMAKTLAENDANIKAKKQAAKQQVGSTCTALSGYIANQGVLCTS